VLDSRTENHSPQKGVQKLETVEELWEAADCVRELTGWDCPVYGGSLRSYFDADVEGKCLRAEKDVGNETRARRVRVDNDEGGPSSEIPSQSDIGTSDDPMEEDWKVARPHQSRTEAGSRDTTADQQTQPESKGKEPV